MESSLCGWGWTSALWRFPGRGDLCLCSGKWSCILSLWRAMLYSVMCFGSFYWLCLALDSLSLLMGGVVFLFYWRFAVRHLALKPTGLWVGTGLSVEMKAFESSDRLMLHWVGSSLVRQSPSLGSPTSGIQAYCSTKTPQVTAQKTKPQDRCWNQHSTAKNTQRNSHTDEKCWIKRK